MRNFLLNDLRYRYSDQILIYIDCNRIKFLLIERHFKIRLQGL